MVVGPKTAGGRCFRGGEQKNFEETGPVKFRRLFMDPIEPKTRRTRNSLAVPREISMFIADGRN